VIRLTLNKGVYRHTVHRELSIFSVAYLGKVWWNVQLFQTCLVRICKTEKQ